MSQRPLVLTIASGGSLSRRIWTGKKPLPIGPSRRWTLERTESGVVLRLAAGRAILFDDSRLEQGARLQLDGASVELRASAKLPPAHAPGRRSLGGPLRVYRRARDWTLDSTELGASYTGRDEGEPVFRVTAAGTRYWLSALAPGGIRVRTPRGLHELRQDQILTLAPDELSELSIHAGSYDWSFNSPEKIALPPSAGRCGEERSSLLPGMAATGALFTAFLLLGLLWPPAENVAVNEPAPLPEITLAPSARLKVALTAPSGARPRASERRADGSPAPAFEGNRLQSAMKGLFRGGMTRLLSKSDYGPGADKSDNARRLFNSRSPALLSTAPVSGPGTGRGTEVSALGGGSAQGGGKGVGYGQGEHANVQGQGKSLVAMDTSGSSVDEGLTKDEVGEVIHRHLSEVRYCYESSMIREPDLEGKLVMGFTISASGKVKVAEVRDSTLSDSRLDDCIVRRLSAWRFPQTKGGIDVAVTYPFIFKTLGG